MFNITAGEMHPSVICVELRNLIMSIRSLRELLSSQYFEEGLQEFIEEYSRHDEVKPSDRTIGFVVVNANRRKVSFSFSAIDSSLSASLEREAAGFRSMGYEVDLDIS
ncbi:MAG: TA0956 family protein [Thermoplasmataceae archaeon]